MSARVIELSGEDAQVAFGEALAGTLPPGSVVFLEGELGAGKTTLARGIARGLGHRGAVKSPTYTLVEPYEALRPPLYHFDLYRLGDPAELEYLGVREYFTSGAVVLVEWPERGEAFLPSPDILLHIEVTPSGRRVGLEGRSAAGRTSVDAALEAYHLREETTPSPLD